MLPLSIYLPRLYNYMVKRVVSGSAVECSVHKITWTVRGSIGPRTVTECSSCEHRTVMTMILVMDEFPVSPSQRDIPRTLKKCMGTLAVNPRTEKVFWDIVIRNTEKVCEDRRVIMMLTIMEKFPLSWDDWSPSVIPRTLKRCMRILAVNPRTVKERVRTVLFRGQCWSVWWRWWWTNFLYPDQKSKDWSPRDIPRTLVKCKRTLSMFEASVNPRTVRVCAETVLLRGQWRSVCSNVVLRSSDAAVGWHRQPSEQRTEGQPLSNSRNSQVPPWQIRSCWRSYSYMMWISIQSLSNSRHSLPKQS